MSILGDLQILIREFSFAVLEWHLTQKSEGLTSFFFYIQQADWMSVRDPYLDIEPQICIKALTGPIITDSGVVLRFSQLYL